ncbi:MAG: hypothetical protein MUF84_20255 [Anaerolineae bacterium]|jgi:hypothetical protein|nr:hypothetical protein [Anaerolineae bacterium]
MIPSVLRRVVRMLRIALTVLGAIWRSSRDWDGILEYDRLVAVIRDGWPVKNDLGAPLPIKMPWG